MQIRSAEFDRGVVPFPVCMHYHSSKFHILALDYTAFVPDLKIIKIKCNKHSYLPAGGRGCWPGLTDNITVPFFEEVRMPSDDDPIRRA